MNQHIAEASEVAPGYMRRPLNQISVQALHRFPYDFKAANDSVLGKFRFQEGIASACGIALDAPDTIQNISAIRPAGLSSQADGFLENAIAPFFAQALTVHHFDSPPQ